MVSTRFLVRGGLVTVVGGVLTASAHAGILQTNANADISASNSDLLQTQLQSANQPSAWAFISGATGTRNPVAPVLANGTATYSTSGVGTPAYQNAYGSQWAQAGNGNSVTFNLDTTLNTLGYDLTQVDFYHGWSDDGRDGMQFLIEVASVADPLTFTTLYTTTKYDPPANYGRQRVTEDSSGILATGVKSIRFTVQNVDNGAGGLSEIDVFGTPVPEPGTLALLSLGSLAVLRRRRQQKKL